MRKRGTPTGSSLGKRLVPVRRWPNARKMPIQRRIRKMADDKSKTKEDRKLVSGDETYEVADFAKQYGVPPSEAKTIIKRYGPSRAKLDTHMKARNA